MQKRAINTKLADSITRVFFRRDQEISADLPDKTDAEGPNVPVPKGVSLISFVHDCTNEVVHATQSTQVSNSDCDFGEEYETDSDDSLFSEAYRLDSRSNLYSTGTRPLEYLC